MAADIFDELREILLRAEGRLSVDAATLGPDDDLYEAGMTSHSSVKVMLAIESVFDIEFEDEMLTHERFATLRSISAAVTELRETTTA